MDYRVGVACEVSPCSRGNWSSRRLRSWVAVCWLVACGPPHVAHPLEARARRVVVACPQDLTASSELHEFSPAICQQHCPKASGRERLSGCFDLRTHSTDELQRIAPGAEALMACDYSEGR